MRSLGVRGWPVRLIGHPKLVASELKVPKPGVLFPGAPIPEDPLPGEPDRSIPVPVPLNRDATRQETLLALVEELGVFPTDPAEGEAYLRAWLELTPRQKQVVCLVCAGHTTLEIARRLRISRNTVKAHINLAFKRFGLRSRAELRVALAGWDFSRWKESSGADPPGSGLTARTASRPTLSWLWSGLGGLWSGLGRLPGSAADRIGSAADRIGWAVGVPVSAVVQGQRLACNSGSRHRRVQVHSRCPGWAYQLSRDSGCCVRPRPGCSPRTRHRRVQGCCRFRCPDRGSP